MTHSRRVVLLSTTAVFLLIAGCFLLPRSLREILVPTVNAATFTVNTADDHNDGTCNGADCTLREAINAVNSGSGGDTISFNISGGGVRTINLTSGLPDINRTVTIDGSTQPGFAGTPLIELNGAAAGATVTGLSFNAQNCIVRGLIINRFTGFGINTDSFGGLVVEGSYIGTNSAGTAAQGNGSGGIRINISNVTIGDTTAAARNIISGNTGNGISVVSGSATIQGNFIGTNASGFGKIPNQTGVLISGAANNTVGGTTPAARNIISGNLSAGISIVNAGATNNLVQGNYVGPDVTGGVALGNGDGLNGDGIRVGQIGTSPSGITIGGTAAGAGNVISGNSFEGLLLFNDLNGVNVQGNLIGPDATGHFSLGTQREGIFINTTSPGAATIGGTSAAARNIISGNETAIGLNTQATGIVIQGNYIGPDITGSAALPNTDLGIFVSTNNTVIGGTAAGAGNVISGNGSDGIAIGNTSSGTLIQGNFIGTKADGVGALGNKANGVDIFTNSLNNFVGGTAAGAGNKIAFNTFAGVAVDTGTGNAILGNSIYSNNRGGIDLTPLGINANDGCDSDSGPNNKQNFPIITTVTPGAPNTTISGTLNSTASTQYRIEFFASASCDSSGNGQGQIFLGSTNVTTDGSCNGSFNFIVADSLITEPFITATATDPNNNTSEFSACVLHPGVTPKTVQFSAANFGVGEGDGHVTVTVTRSGNTSAGASVDYRTTDTDNFTVNCANKAGQAFGRCDFATVVGTLTWAAGDAASKSFDVPIINDSYGEGAETFGLSLTNPAGASLGSTAIASVTITDNEASDGPNPILQTSPAAVSFFVRQHYLDFLGREPEPGEPWSPILNGCASQFNTDPLSPSAGCDRITVSGAFFGSPEFKDKGIYVIDFYRVAFNRLPTYSEFVFDLASVTGSTAPEVQAKRAAFANNFVLRGEFATLAGLSNTNYVNTLMSHNGQYNLGAIRTPDPANPDGATKVTLTSADLINGLNGATLTRAQVLRAIVQSDEVTQNLESVNAFVASQYFGYLRRAPDTTGFNNWVDYLRNNPTDFRTMVHGFLDSIEYRLRFGPV
jgi:CSLREA domain-containing protein